ncbi:MULTISPECIES: DUF262 domain-containing protein [Serratia]|uniref:DUF262 domain-containing protein n=1 Tax=Serratia TaxID=613 RepID=UPI0011F36339|nr:MULTISPECIES: DUF262 domain-containing protein [Serratia]NRN12948.1 DUF262 domain-containing protein [Serratia marcescens]NRN36010.1 DUF262 domain-containing protein [Serratia marcescens]HBH6949993.1 DUF262 domain-containing protein [Serratia marcescens]HBH6954313.1 DUF262 domain-containing protein [Serratia marcescens]
MDRVDYQSLVVQDLINIRKSDELDLAPWYQRRSVWTPAQKAYLINTMFEQKPIPAIYIRHSLDLIKSKSIKEVVDGQQRCRSIISYANNEFSAKHPKYKKKVKISELTQDDRQKFLLTSLPVGYLLGASDSDVIDIFGRINSISKSLNSQEKRNAAYSGEMKQFCLAQSSSRINFWRDYGIFSSTDISRMNEVQFTSDLIYNIINGLSDFSNSYLDQMYKEYDDEFNDEQKITERLNATFNKLAEIEPRKFSDTIFKRQPLFFSLFLIVDELGNKRTRKIGEVIDEIDSIFNADNKKPDDIAFANACSSTTQRIAQRKIRADYIKRFF